jgi:membrane-bound lytic murein transglycosylase C
MIKLSPVLGVLLTALFFLPWGAAAQKDFPSFRDEQVQSFQEFVKQSNAELRQYCRKVRKAFSEYRRKAAAVWGEEGAAVPGRKQWVSYRREMRERFMVDFKQGRARYEVALKPGEKRISDAVKSRLEASIVDSITRGPDQRSIQKIAADPDRVEPGGAPLLKGLFATRSGKPVTPDNARKFARRMVNRHAKRSRVKGEDGRSRVVASVKIPMIPDHLRKRAQKYEHIVKEQARIRSLDPELVFSIIETESYFNPQARSPVPAFGLMQLVPVTGGKEAYRIVYGEDKQPSQELLYQPEANVTLGSAYFQRLYFTYMKGIQNDRSRLWCAIASYNTGPSNLYRTFSEKGKDQAIRRINSMSSEEVYRYLVNNLPYRETRNYVKKVRKKMPKYKRL